MYNRPDIAQLRRYVRGELSPQQMHEVERAAEADESLMDVLLGIEAEHAQGLTHDVIPELQQRIQQRSHVPARRTSSYLYRWIGLAASLLIVFGIGIYVFMQPESVQQQIAQRIPPSEPSKTIRDTTSSSSEDNTILDREEALPTKDHETKLAYSNVEASASNRLKNSDAARQAALDTIPIQIIPSNAEELVSMSLRDDHSTLASRNSAPPMQDRISMLSARAGRPMRQSNELQSVSLQDVKSITTGIIIDHQTQKPIAGALIRDQEMNTLAKTDSTGRFIVGSTNEKPILTIQSNGFETADHVAEGAMRIALKRAPNGAATEPRTARDVSAKRLKSRPAIGSQAYQLYVNNLAKTSALGAGEVTLLFGINAQGRPIGITIKKSGGKKRDKEAIKILENGPNWIKGTDDELAEWTVQF